MGCAALAHFGRSGHTLSCSPDYAELVARSGKGKDPEAAKLATCLSASADRTACGPPTDDGGSSERRFAHQHEVVDWGRVHHPSEMVTLNALRILRAAERLPEPTCVADS